MTGKEYETFVKNYLAALSKSMGIRDIEFIKEKQYQGVRRTWRIDISYSFAHLGFNYWVFVECKCWNRVIDINDVTKIHDAIIDCGAQKGIVVSTMGFTQPAFNFAKQARIGMATLSDKNELVIHLNANGNAPDMTVAYTDTLGEKYLGGIVYPSQTIYQYIAKKIGTENAMRVKGQNFWRYFSLENEKLEKEIAQFHSWINEYHLLETGGLPLHIPPEFGSNELYYKLSKFLAEQTYNG